jgi:hypothetical protein
MWPWLFPFDTGSFQSAKKKDEIIHDIRGISEFSLSNDRFFLIRKGIARNAYFPVACVLVKNVEDASVLEVRYICPLFYMIVAVCALVELWFILNHVGEAAVLMPIIWCIWHAVGCMAFQTDKENLEAKIRAVL